MICRGGFHIRPFVSGAYGMLPYEALKIKDYLLASSIATATAICHKNNLRLLHHRVVTGADQIPHLGAVSCFEAFVYGFGESFHKHFIILF